VTLYLAGGTLDRVANLRKDADWLADRLTSPKTRVVPIRPPEGPIDPSTNGLAVITTVDVELPDDAILLGVEDDVAWFAYDVEEVPSPLPSSIRWAELRMAGGLLSVEEGSLLAHAVGMVNWHRRHRFCGCCGAETKLAEAGYMRVCGTCATEHFPRTDPAVIMLVTCQGHALLGRQKVWPRGMYSALAGFVEPGESLEAAVRREVAEEAGVVVGRVEYRASQPWPFPSSLMLGFRAEASSLDLKVDTTELEDARWFTAEELQEATSDGSVFLPPPVSIARFLVDGWLAEQ
jgi:NAD+ diphosphatase